MAQTPEQRARQDIDADLQAAGWVVQDRDHLDLTAGRGIAAREFPMQAGFGFADYLLYVDRKAIGAIEAKALGTLTGVEAQSAKYAAGLPNNLPAHRRPLPFLFESNGSVTFFTNGLDPFPRSRKVLAECDADRTFNAEQREWLDRMAEHIATSLAIAPEDSYGQGWCMRTGKQSVNLASINLSILRSFPVPLSHAKEQDVIVEAVEDQLSVIDHLEADLETKLKSAQSLRQAILRHAFTGQLVPQDPNDEPASELLERIAAERAARAGQAAAAKNGAMKRPKRAKKS